MFSEVFFELFTGFVLTLILAYLFYPPTHFVFMSKQKNVSQISDSFNFANVFLQVF